MASNDFVVNLRARVDTSDISKQLKQISQTTTVNVDVKGKDRKSVV